MVQRNNSSQSERTNDQSAHSIEQIMLIYVVTGVECRECATIVGQ